MNGESHGMRMSGGGVAHSAFVSGSNGQGRSEKACTDHTAFSHRAESRVCPKPRRPKSLSPTLPLVPPHHQKLYDTPCQDNQPEYQIPAKVPLRRPRSVSPHTIGRPVEHFKPADIILTSVNSPISVNETDSNATSRLVTMPTSKIFSNDSSIQSMNIPREPNPNFKLRAVPQDADDVTIIETQPKFYSIIPNEAFTETNTDSFRPKIISPTCPSVVGSSGSKGSSVVFAPQVRTNDAPKNQPISISKQNYGIIPPPLINFDSD
ncbi:hypothetical protein Ciccas_001286 [Cichlidogyrus casuarinus]|uniref:Uncharacterized protein n=1 Tax=Cichlidogyrus casuarinus TaxID=1844966 RepID=A0ABD2QKI5_9PLAT